MADGKPLDNWRDYKDGSAQAHLAEMSITLLNTLAGIIAKNHYLGVKSGFTLGVHTLDSDDHEVVIEVEMQVTYNEKAPSKSVVH